MNATVDLDDLKQHLNIDKDYTDEDKYLLDLFSAAVMACENYIDQPIDNFVEDGELDAPLLQAVKILVATWYMNRESVAYGAPQKVPHTLEFLLQSYISYGEKRNCCCK